METLAYCIQCRDVETGKVGSFIYSSKKPFYAISPVCQDIIELGRWMEENDYKFWESSSLDDMRVYKVV